MVAATVTDDPPMSEMNTTPLIDVMLVLLIMFIITIPAQSHAVKVDLPIHSEQVQPVLERNKLVVTARGTLLWNAQTVSLAELSALLDRVAMTPRQPELQFEPEPDARYEQVDAVLAVIKRANVSTFGFVGNERYARF